MLDEINDFSEKILFRKQTTNYLLQFGFTLPLESASHTFDLLLRPDTASAHGALELELTDLTTDENIYTLCDILIFWKNVRSGKYNKAY
jgi:hypothetical protein